MNFVIQRKALDTKVTEDSHDVANLTKGTTVSYFSDSVKVFISKVMITRGSNMAYTVQKEEILPAH